MKSVTLLVQTSMFLEVQTKHELHVDTTRVGFAVWIFAHSASDFMTTGRDAFDQF